MKKALLKDSFKEIRHSFGRFISIMLIVMLGVAFFAGLRAAGPDMRKTADDYFDKNKLADVHILSTLGFSEKDISAIKKSEYADVVDAEYSYDVLMTHDGTDKVIKLMSISENGLNTLELKEGHMPQNEGECVVLAGKTQDSQIAVGENISFKSGTEDDIADTLKRKDYTVVGIVDSPYLISFSYGTSKIGSGTVNGVIFIDEGNFDLEVYTDVFVSVKGARELDCFTEDYNALVDKAVADFENIADVREVERYDEIKQEAQSKIDDAQTELDDKKAQADEELSDAQKQITDAETGISDAQKNIDKNQHKLDDEKKNAQEKIDEAQGEIEKAERDYKKGLSEYKKGEKSYKKGVNKLNDAKIEYEEGEDTLKEYEKGLADAEQEIEDAKQLIADNEAEIAKKEAKLANEGDALSPEEKKQLENEISSLKYQNARLEYGIAAGEMALEDYKTEISKAKDELADAKKEIDKAQEKLDKSRKKLDKAKKKLDDAKKDIDSAKKTLLEKKKELSENVSSAQSKLDDASAKLEDAKGDLETGKADYAQAKADADEQISEAQGKIDDARSELKDLEEPVWYVRDRSEACFGFSDYVDGADRMDAIAKIFPLIFITVAALVSLNAMTRMVEEQRTLIGTLKGLGYSDAAIAGKYILYAALASVIGSVVGVAAGIRVFPSVIYGAYGIMFNMPALEIGFYPATAVTAAVVAVLVTTLAAYFACMGSLKSEPAKLMRPKAPKAGKRVFLERIGFIWNHLSFTKKVTARNLFRYKKRFVMTVFGIGAAVALLLVGFGVRDSVNNILVYQFEDIYNYQLMVTGNDADMDELKENIVKLDNIDSATQAFMKSVEFSTDSAKVTATLTAFNDNAALTGYINLRNRRDGTPIELTDDGVILTEKMANILGVGVGDTVEMHDGTKLIDVSVSGITEHYAMHYVYMTYSSYEKYFKEEVEPNVLLAHMSGEYDTDSLGKEILKNDGVVSVSFTSDIMDRFKDMLSSLNYVVLVLIVSAATLCLLILYNLTNINVSERYREIATIKVLGFYDNEVLSYVYRENFILTGIAILLGLVGGVFLHQYIIKTVEVAAVMFGRTINGLSLVWAALLTVTFTLAVNFIMYFKLKKIDMVEALKSVE